MTSKISLSRYLVEQQRDKGHIGMNGQGDQTHLGQAARCKRQQGLVKTDPCPGLHGQARNQRQRQGQDRGPQA